MQPQEQIYCADEKYARGIQKLVPEPVRKFTHAISSDVTQITLGNTARHVQYILS